MGEFVMQGDFYVLSNEAQVEGFMTYLRKQMESGQVKVQVKPVKQQRTDQQRKAIEVYCKLVADALNEAGYDKVAFFRSAKSGAKVPWTQDAVKDDIWRTVQQAVLKKKSTTALTKQEVSQIYDIVNGRVLAERGLFVPFPEVSVHA